MKTSRQANNDKRTMRGVAQLATIMASLPFFAAMATAHEGHDHTASGSETPAATKGAGDNLADKKELVVYTNRKEDLIRPLLDKFSKQTHARLRVYYGGDSLVERIKQEGSNTPADIVITQNIAMVQQLKDAGYTDTIPEPLTKSLPVYFVDAEHQWAGVSYRARIIVVAKNSKAMSIVNMKQLADDQWRGQICIRDGFHPYNLGLFSSLRVYLSDKETKDYLKKLKGNLMQKPGGNDRDEIKLVYGGQCQIAVVNSYYYGLLKKEIPDLESKATPRLVSLVGDKLGEGVAANISGVAVIKSGKNKPMAQSLVKFLLSKESQEYFMTKNNEYPVKSDVAWGKNLVSLNGKKFTSDTRAMVESYKHYPFIIKTLLSTDFNSN
ncbi:MAG: extracellular solute-binding protein [Hydrotalea sp.]|nr:extracellular solute-binding protein [Hydrotalea sp.]